jgi:DNA-binding transcriptional regulator YiaG
MDKSLRKPLIPGMSRRAIAEELNVSWRTVERWEQTGKVPGWVPRMIELIREPKFSNWPPAKGE